jgi:hypothetical protein
MRKNVFGPLAGPLTACLLSLLPGCSKQPVGKTYTYHISRPIYALKTSVLAGINGQPSQSFDSVGKFYIDGKTIFLSEINKGIHIIDNSDPVHPVQIAFLNIPGNEDIAIKGNTLYADMYTDLLAIDISNPRRVQISGMVQGLFPMEGYLNGQQTDSNLVITGYISKDTTVSVPGRVINGYYCANCPAVDPGGIALDFSSASASASTGVAGSMARMAMIKDYLYVISESHSLGIVKATDPPHPSLVSIQPGGFDLETIYPFGDKLFLGSAEGVYIYGVDNPVQPQQEGQFEHGHACDPVITDGSYAYITLHAGSYCGGASNELDVVNVSDLPQTSLVKVYPMTRPEGLCKDGNLLFVCDDSAGVKVYDASKADNLKLLTLIPNVNGYDVVASNDLLLVVTSQGLYQYNYSDIAHIRFLSFFEVK